MMLMFQKLNWTKSMFFAHFCLEMIARYFRHHFGNHTNKQKNT